MNESEIRELEIATECQLPSAYREILLHYPQRLTTLAAKLDDDEPAELFHSMESLFRANVNDAEYTKSIFPKSFFVIGESGCGDYYAIDTASADAPVYMGGPHEGEYPQDAEGKSLPIDESIRAYVDDLITRFEGHVADLDNDTVYSPPGKLRLYLSICLSVLLAPVILLLMLLSIILAGPFSLLMRLWERCCPSRE